MERRGGPQHAEPENAIEHDRQADRHAIGESSIVDEHPDLSHAFDTDLLQNARQLWQAGEWRELVEMLSQPVHHHPERAKLALLAAAGHQALGDLQRAQSLTQQAMRWGCSKRLAGQVLISGVYNSLGKAACLNGDSATASKYFEKSLTIGARQGETALLAEKRTETQLLQMGVASATVVLARPTQEASIATMSNADQGQQLKFELRNELQKELKANNPNPYVHNRTFTPELNKALRDFAQQVLGRADLRANYLDYLATKATQVERSCVGRLATTVQDAVARQLVCECLEGETVSILEIGALYGISLAILYNHAVARYPKVHVTCLDPFDGYYGKALDAVLNCPVSDLTFFRNMKLANVPREDYTLIKHYSTEPAAIAAAGRLEFNLLVIDGDHSYDGVAFDFHNYYPLLRPGGYVIFDDYNAKEWPGVQRFIDEDLPRIPGIEYLGAVSRTAVARKPALQS
jgi:tetratricopeptide (TPR) repeat protein